MGQTLSEPVTAKETTSCSNEAMYVGASCMQGWRINMEDSHTHILSLGPEDPDAAFFAVYDGHGGDKVAHYAGNHLHKKILQQPEYEKGNIEEAMKLGFLQLDSDMLADPEMRDQLAGTTAICMLIKNNRLYIGNVGDSRAVASWAGRVDPLSADHKPSNESEAKRIVAAGGWVDFNRVNGNLALSRALGDFVFKRNEKKSSIEQIVTAFPDVETRTITEDLEFVILACDGIWDVMTNEEVVEFVRCRIAEKMEPPVICEQLMTRCLAPDCQMGGLGCDNMTVILICFLHGKTYEDLSVRCSMTPLARNRLHSTGSSDSSLPSTSCSFSTPETPDEEIVKTGEGEAVAVEAVNSDDDGGGGAIKKSADALSPSETPNNGHSPVLAGNGVAVA